MAFGFAGAAGGAAQSLEEIVAQRILEEKLAAEIADRQQRMSMEQSRLDETKRENTYNRERTDRIDSERQSERAKVDTREATERNARSDMANVLMMPGMDQSAINREIAGSSLRTGTEVPRSVSDLLAPPPAPKKYSVRTVDAKGNPINKLVTEEEMQVGVPEYREPKAGTEKGPYVVGGNLVDASGNVIFRGQDASAQGPSPYAIERNSRTVAAIDDIVGLVGPWSAGYGSLLSDVPQSDARQLRGKLDQLKANIAFNELTAMREASKTGGALGSVAVRELQLLESALGNLDQAQEPAQLVSELGKIKESAERWRQAAGSQANAMQPATSHGATPGATTPGALPPTTPRRMRFDKTGKPIP